MPHFAASGVCILTVETRNNAKFGESNIQRCVVKFIGEVLDIGYGGRDIGVHLNMITLELHENICCRKRARMKRLAYAVYELEKKKTK